MKKLNSDFTAVVKDDYGVHVLKCKIIDEHNLHFQTMNVTTDMLSPLFKIKADYGTLKFATPKGKFLIELYKEIEESQKLTKNVNRNSLIGYYQQLKLQALVGRYNEL